MGIFSNDTRVTTPFKQQKTTAVNYLRDLITGGTPSLPTRQVTGLNELQRIIQSGLQDQYGDMNANYDTARGHYTDVVNNKYDPRTSDYYEGLRAEARDLKTESTNDIRQSANLGGMLHSTPRMSVEAENNRKIDNQLLTLLGGMYENERSRVDAAAGELDNLDANRTANAGNRQAIAELERQIQQEREDAMYNQVLQTVMFPYTYMANLVPAITGAGQPYAEGGGLTDLGFVASMGTSALDSYWNRDK